MVVIVVISITVPHSSIPYLPKVSHGNSAHECGHPLIGSTEKVGSGLLLMDKILHGSFKGSIGF